MARRRRMRLAIADDDGTAMFAVAADRLGWKVIAATGADAGDIHDATGASVVDLDDMIERVDADIVVLGTPPDRRLTDAERLTARGLHIILLPIFIPGQPAPFRPGRKGAGSGHTVGSGGGLVCVGDPFPTAPAMQTWFAGLAGLGDIARLTGSATAPRCDDGSVPAQIWSLVSSVVLSARLLGWGRFPTSVDDGSAPDRVRLRFGTVHAAELSIDVAESATPPRWELQAAGLGVALRVEMFPEPRLEHNGEPIAVRNVTDPAEAFGTIGLLTTLAADIADRRQPVLGLDFHDEIAALVAAIEAHLR